MANKPKPSPLKKAKTFLRLSFSLSLKYYFIFTAIGTLYIVASWFIKSFKIEPISDRIVEYKILFDSYVNLMFQIDDLRTATQIERIVNDSTGVNVGLINQTSNYLSLYTQGLKIHSETYCPGFLSVSFSNKEDSLDKEFHVDLKYIDSVVGILSKTKEISSSDLEEIKGMYSRGVDWNNEFNVAIQEKYHKFNKIYKSERDRYNSTAIHCLIFGTVLITIGNIFKFLSEYKK